MSLSIEQQVAVFKALLSQSKFDLADATEDIVNVFVETIKQSNVGTEPIVTKKKKAVEGVKKPKRKSGYTLFLSDKMGKEKMNMVEAVQNWKQLPEEEKAVWNQKSKELKTDVVKKPRKKSGYSIFMSVKMREDRLQMGEAVQMWKQMTGEDRAVWNEKVNKTPEVNKYVEANENLELTEDAHDELTESENQE